MPTLRRFKPNDDRPERSECLWPVHTRLQCKSTSRIASDLHSRRRQGSHMDPVRSKDAAGLSASRSHLQVFVHVLGWSGHDSRQPALPSQIIGYTDTFPTTRLFAHTN